MRIRSLAAVSTVVATALLLSACSGSTDPETPATPDAAGDQCTVAAEPGAASDSVTIEGEFGEVSTAVFETGQSVEELERTVVVEGDGARVAADEYVEYALSAFDGETGERLGDAGYEDGELLPGINSEATGLLQVIGCATVGSRLSVAFPGSAQAGPQLYIVDVLGITPMAAWGEEQEPTPGMPEVTLAEDGAPTVVIPDADAPEELQIAVLKEGDGVEVATGDTSLLQYYGVDWATGETFDQSWSNGAPLVLEGNPYVAGFVAALEGQKVGSQVLVVMPPSLGYGEDPEAHDLGGKTLVFVIDILATQHPIVG
ncbi:FKBP-type peptidyl-prolyl cis-trans isomerase [Microbacterium sp. NIBRBAC000506063]|uniref:FKBP-type peptidyl-prolyl cis-trans isomerase n=1 Tax=Microbacterium sp. NIBRBAC000506063 TaxID=2734618 RepID=UPI001BB62F74|nr:FKBP-type peptidyl-prolyl cis-trans isomerase [Microbacterium sp. NIBRBAC000506063]QTV79522.1 FKBP-type peptidyl-prolyl cis-trans isomerase [Microbacterium sp. NIBRBAC000506063]